MIGNLNSLLQKETGEELSPARLSVAMKWLGSPEEMWAAIQDFPLEAGWLCLTDEVLVLRSREDLEKAHGRILLSGELVYGDRSLHVRQGENGWSLVRLEKGIGEECLMLCESFISTEDKQQLRLDYEVFWKNGGRAYEPYAFRFIGFSHAKEGV